MVRTRRGTTPPSRSVIRSGKPGEGRRRRRSPPQRRAPPRRRTPRRAPPKRIPRRTPRRAPPRRRRSPPTRRAPPRRARPRTVKVVQRQRRISTTQPRRVGRGGSVTREVTRFSSDGRGGTTRTTRSFRLGGRAIASSQTRTITRQEPRLAKPRRVIPTVRLSSRPKPSPTRRRTSRTSFARAGSPDRAAAAAQRGVFAPRVVANFVSEAIFPEEERAVIRQRVEGAKQRALLQTGTQRLLRTESDPRENVFEEFLLDSDAFARLRI